MRAGPRGPPSAPPPARSLMRGCGKSPDVPTLEGVRARGRGAPGREQLRIEVEEHRSATLGPSRRPHRCSTPAGMAKTAPAVSPGGTTRAAGRCQAQKRAFSPGWSSAEAAARACAGCLGPHPEPIGSPAGVGAPAASGTPVYELRSCFVGAKLHPKVGLLYYFYNLFFYFARLPRGPAVHATLLWTRFHACGRNID